MTSCTTSSCVKVFFMMQSSTDISDFVPAQSSFRVMTFLWLVLVSGLIALMEIVGAGIPSEDRLVTTTVTYVKEICGFECIFMFLDFSQLSDQIQNIESHILLEISFKHRPGKDGKKEDQEQKLQKDSASLRVNRHQLVM